MRRLPPTPVLTLVLAALLCASACVGGVGGAGTGGTGGGSTCSAGQMSCGGVCKNVASDPENCGTCGTACGANKTCQSGVCQCAGGLVSCGGACVASDATHCGPSCAACPTGQVCSNGACAAMCPDGAAACTDGACPSATDSGHCGGCTACSGGATCTAGTCSCPVASQMQCGSPAMCLDVMTNLQHCGACNRACAAGQTCTAGNCTGSTGTGGTMGMGGTTGTGGTASACTALPPVTRRLMRLSVAQYQNAVRDLMGSTAVTPLTNTGGEAAFAFFADASIGVDDNFQFALYQAAEATVFPSGVPSTRIPTLAPCTGTTAAAQMTCAMTFAQSFGGKAFRRPLEAAEVTNLMKVYTQGIMTDYNTAIGLMIEALIISPSFVYRTELGPSTLMANAAGMFPATTITPYEVAAQLGFLFLGSLPDAGLMAAAADGSLGTPAGLTTQINRLIALPAVKTNLTGIIIDWFNVRQMFEKTKDTALFTALTTADRDQTAIVTDLLNSTQRFVTDVLWTNPGTINDLVTSQKMFVNRRLFTLYGMTGTAPANNDTWVSTTWPAAQGRSGILTNPAFLWSASDPALTSIVKRGKLIHDDVICQDPLPPPVDLTTPSALNVISCKSPDGVTSLSACDSEITQSDARMMYQPCKACHSQMDPYSRVVQNFGPIGNYRTVDEANRAINASVAFVPTSPLAPQMLTGAAAFGQALVTSGVVSGCSVQKIASYTLGSMIRTYNTCEIQDVRAQFDGTITSLFRQVALANFARARAGGTK